jgi:predicted Rdx family selenoprotein
VEAEIKQAFPDATITLIKSSGGIFEVKASNDVVFSKRAIGRFPNKGEIVAALKQKTAG